MQHIANCEYFSSLINNSDDHEKKSDRNLTISLQRLNNIKRLVDNTI